MKSNNGLWIFIDKANNDILRVSGNYLFERKFSKNLEKSLQDANEKMFKALMDRQFFTELNNKFNEEYSMSDED